MRRYRYQLIALAILALLPLVAMVLDEPFLISIATRILIIGTAAIGIDLLVGLGGLASLGHALFFGLGAYLTVMFNTIGADHPAWQVIGREALLAWPITLLIVGAVATVLGYLCLRARGFQFIMITLAFAQMFYLIVTSTAAFGGDEGFRMPLRQELAGLSLADATGFYCVCLIVVAGVLALAYMLADSRYGTVLKGIRQNERRMSFLGYRTQRYLLCAFVLAALVAGLAGMLLANQNRFASPSALSWIQSGDFLIMVLIGGLGTLHGGLIGAAVFILLEQVLSGWFQDWQLFLGVPLLLLVLFAKHGIDGLFTRRATRE